MGFKEAAEAAKLKRELANGQVREPASVVTETVSAGAANSGNGVSQPDQTSGTATNPTKAFGKFGAAAKPVEKAPDQSRTVETAKPRFGTFAAGVTDKPAKGPFGAKPAAANPVKEPGQSSDDNSKDNGAVAGQPATKPTAFGVPELNILDIANTQVEVNAEEFQHFGQPREFTEQEAQQLKNTFKALEDGLTDKAIVGEAVKTIVTQLRSNPNLKNILLPENFGMMVRGLRQAYGYQAAKRSEVKSKKAAVSEEANEMLREMADFGFKIGS